MNNLSPLLRRCLFLLLLAPMVTSDSTAQRFEPRIVFTSNRNGNWDIYSMDANGNNLLQLTDHPASDEVPACSPDGRRIAFMSERDGSPDLYVMDSSGNNVIRLTNSKFGEYRASWSPDGMKIAFPSIRDGNSEIHAMDADGNNLTRLTKHEPHDVSPSWSPDGSKIAFISGPQNAQFHPLHIFVMNADGKGLLNLTGDTDLTDSFSPSWSPDGKKIVFSSRPNFRVRHIYVMTAEGKMLKRLTNEKGYSGSPVYSPDGSKIAFESNRDGDWNIYLMDTDGRRTDKLTKNPHGAKNRFPSWLSASGTFAVNSNGKLPTSWGVLKRSANP